MPVMPNTFPYHEADIKNTAWSIFFNGIRLVLNIYSAKYIHFENIAITRKISSYFNVLRDVDLSEKRRTVKNATFTDSHILCSYKITARTPDVCFLSSSAYMTLTWYVRDHREVFHYIWRALQMSFHGILSFSDDDVIKWKQFPRYWPFVRGPVTGEFPAQRPVTRSFDASFDMHLNKWLSKHSWARLMIWDAIAPIMTSL